MTSGRKSGSGSRHACSACGRVHSSSKSEAACKAAADARSKLSSRDRTIRKSSSRRTSRHTRVASRSERRTSRGETRTGKSSRTGRETRTGTGTGTDTSRGGGGGGRSRKYGGGGGGGRYMSTSLGPGAGDPLLIALMVILTIACLVLLVIGIWLLVASDGWPVGLNLTGSIGWTRVISYAVACIVLGLLFIPIVVLAYLAASARRGSQARVTRLCAVFLAALAVVILIMMTFTSLFFATNSPPFISNIIFNGWVNTVTDDARALDACRIQSRYECEGWEHNSCRNCRPTQSGIYNGCTNVQREICPRCWEESRRSLQVAPGAGGSLFVRRLPFDGKPVKEHFVPTASDNNTGTDLAVVSRTDVLGCRMFVLRRYREFFIPFTVVTIFLSLVLILLSWKTCIDSSGRR